MATESEPAIPQAARERSGRRRRREQVRTQLLRSAIELADGSSFRELSVDRIARAAGLSRPAFYTHFRDKNDLLLAALEELVGELDGAGGRCWEAEGPPAEGVRGAIETVVSFYADNLALLRAVTEVATYDEEVAESWARLVGRLIEATADHVRAEQRAGLIPGAVDAEATSEALAWMAERCCHVHLARGGRKPEELVGQLAPVWTAALYPGVIPADQLRPGVFGSQGPWAVSAPEGGEAEQG
jgi:TetR/AcrR family transcriptional regulator, ethionamide resistance regulator